MKIIFIQILLLLIVETKIPTKFNDLPKFLENLQQPQASFQLFPIKSTLDKNLGQLKQILPTGYLYNEDDYVVLQKFQRPLDKLFYVQGFKFWNSSTILESSGLYGESVIHYLDATSFKELKSFTLNHKFFGEGSDWIINKDGKREIHQMTYKEKKCKVEIKCSFVYDSDLNLKKTFDMPQLMLEGWGLTRSPNGKFFYATDGTHRVFQIDPETWEIKKIIEVRWEDRQAVNKLNDLVFINGKLFINIYLTSKIVQVHPEIGSVQSIFQINFRKFNFQKLVDEFQKSDFYRTNNFNGGHCLNGMAFDPDNEKLFITGKKWPYIYEIKFKNVV